MKESEVRSRCVLKDLATTVREMTYLRQLHLHCQCVDLLYAAWFDLRVETGYLVCAFMQADSSCEMFARLPKGQHRDGWIWRLRGALKGMRTASRDFTEFLAGTLTEHMGSNVGNWSDVCLCMSRTKDVWHLMWTTLSSVPSQQRLKNLDCRSRSWL